MITKIQVQVYKEVKITDLKKYVGLALIFNHELIQMRKN